LGAAAGAGGKTIGKSRFENGKSQSRHWQKPIYF
jgi:hypothetical protein